MERIRQILGLLFGKHVRKQNPTDVPKPGIFSFLLAVKLLNCQPWLLCFFFFYFFPFFNSISIYQTLLVLRIYIFIS